jgi:hypothetical protein
MAHYVDNATFNYRDLHHSTGRDHGFGRVVAIKWRSAASPTEADQLGAAQLQHLYACRITQQLKRRGESIREYSVRTRVGYDRLAKVLRGEAVMRLEDIAQAQRLLGGILSGVRGKTSRTNGANGRMSGHWSNGLADDEEVPIRRPQSRSPRRPDLVA